MNVLRCVGLLVLCLFEPMASSLALAVESGASVPARRVATSSTEHKKPAKTVTTKPKPKAVHRGVASKSRVHPSAEVIATPIPAPKLDLSLPSQMVKVLEPATKPQKEISRSLLPAMFSERPAQESPFQLSGRLLSNEMQLQLRNEGKQEIDGAAIDFKFTQ